MPWRDINTDPLETLPGPSNPWLSCSGGSGRVPEEGVGISDNKPPDFGDIVPDEGSIKIDWKTVGAGFAMLVAGILMIIAAVVAALVAIATLPVSTPVLVSAGIAAILVAIAATGSVLAGAGGATMMGGIDPKILDYKKRVEPTARRTLRLPHGLPADVVNLLTSIAEIEQLSTGEVDIIDHARAAAAVEDKDWYEQHMQDLFNVQSQKQHYMQELVHALRGIVKTYDDQLDQTQFDDSEPLRDLVNPITEMRPALKELADVGDSDINSVLFHARIPSQTQLALEKSVHAHLKDSKTPGKLLQKVADQLEEIEYVSWDAFGGKP